MKRLNQFRRLATGRSRPEWSAQDEETSPPSRNSRPSSYSGIRATQSQQSDRIALRRSNLEPEGVSGPGAAHLRFSVTTPPPRSSVASSEVAEMDTLEECSLPGSDSEKSNSSTEATPSSQTARGGGVKSATSNTSGAPLLGATRKSKSRTTAMHGRVDSSTLHNMSSSVLFGPPQSVLESRPSEQLTRSMSRLSQVEHSGSGGGDALPQSSVFGSFFDLTTERLTHIFDEFDQDEDGRVSYEALRQGLLHWAGIHINGDRHFDKLVRLLDADHSHDISFNEFEGGVRLLMMQQLFSTDVGLETAREEHRWKPESPPLQVVDYSAVSVRRTTVATEEHMHEFMFSKREAWVASRWIDAYGCDNEARTLKRLAVKYRLHPLALEAAMSPLQRPKVDKYSTHYCIIVPFFSCERVPGPEDSWKNGERFGSPRTLTVGSKDRGNAGTRPFCCCPRRVRERDGAQKPERPHRLRTKTENVCIFICCSAACEHMLCDTLITFQREKPEPKCWERVLGELGKSYAKLRQYDTQYLAYVILDVLVDRLFPLMQAFNTVVDSERDQLASKGVVDLASLYEHRTQLQQLLRSMRPLGKLLTHIIEDEEICEGVTLYLRNVQDNVESVEDDLRTLISKCENLEAEFEKFRASQTERTLYGLSIVSSIFLPAQFLTGVFGMNFEYMPELHWRYSYPIFWMVTIAVMIPMMVYFRCGRMG